MSFCLPYPPDSDGIVPPIEIPYVAKYSYDTSIPNLFENFPRECGFDSYDRSADELAALMQSWLFFGLISEVCGKDIDHATLIRTRFQEGQTIRFVDSRLDSILDALITDRLVSLGNISKHRTDSIWLTIMRWIQFAEERAFIFENLPIAQNPCLTLVALSVHLLLQWMKLKFNAHRPTQLQSLGLPCNIFEWFPLSAKVMIERLCSQGWCPYRVLNTCSNLSSVTLYYLSSMPLQGATRGNHNKCTTEKCVATTKSQDVSHRKVNCTCSIRSEIKPDMERVKTLVESGEIPLVEAEKNSDNGEIEIRVVKATPYTRYTAISHVWSDCQLGSKKNSLPLCQLEHLMSRIKGNNKNFGSGYWLFDSLWSRLARIAWHCKLTKDMSDGKDLFWLDTFCVPNEDLEEDAERKQIVKELRVKAINMMDLIYSDADEVLVLDHELETIKGGAQPTPIIGEGIIHPCVQVHVGPNDDRLMQTLAYAFSSNWMGRAWTLQEAVLARRCILQFQDCGLDTQYLGTHTQRASHLSNEVVGTTSLIWFTKTWTMSRQKQITDTESQHDIPESKLSQNIRFVLIIISTLVGYIILPCTLIAAYLSRDMDLYFTRTKLALPEPEDGSVHSFVIHELGACIRESLKSPIVQAYSHSYYPPNSAERFRMVWNSLVGRSTTEPEDLHVILANLLGMNASFMMKHCSAPQDRMKAIFTELDELPLDILFLNVIKVAGASEAPATAEQTGWMPLYPGQGRLNVQAKMMRTESGYVLQINDALMVSVLVARAVPRHTRSFRITSYKARISANDPGKYEQLYEVEDFDQNNRSYQENDAHQDDTYIIFHNSSISRCSGARLTVTRRESNNIFLRYDCAVRVWKQKQPSKEQNLPSFRARAQPIYSNLVLEHNTIVSPIVSDSSSAVPGQRLRLPRRPMNYLHENHEFINALTNFFGIISVFIILCIILAFFALEVDRSQSQGFKTATIVFSVLFSHATCVFWFMIPRDITRYTMRTAYHHAWASTFREDWKPGDKSALQWVRNSVMFIWKVGAALTSLGLWVEIRGERMLNVLSAQFAFLYPRPAHQWTCGEHQGTLEAAG